MTLHGYDFSDLLVRRMVEENHIPYEGVTTTMEGTTLHPVLCEKCQAQWPCPQIRALREWQAVRYTDRESPTTNGALSDQIMPA